MRMVTAAILLLASCVLGNATSPGAARAQADEVDLEDEEARGLFEAGRAAFNAGRFEDALGHFQRAYELSARPHLLFNVGATFDRLRRDQEAVQAFDAYLRALPEAQNRREVEGRIRILRQSIEESDAAATVSRPTDASAEDGLIGDGIGDDWDESDAVENPSEPAGGGGRMWSWVAAGGAVAFAGAAVGLWLAGDSEFDDLESSCGATGCSDEQIDASSVATFDTMTNVALALSLGLGVTTVVLFFVEGASADEERVSLRLGPGSASLRGRF